MFETPNLKQLLEKVGVRQMVLDLIQELVELAAAYGCSFSSEYSQTTIDKMTSTDTPSTMYQDFQSRRPMELETYLGSPIKLATQIGVKIPRVETLYTLLHHVNATNLSKPREATPPVAAQPGQAPPRVSSVPPPRNGPPMRPQSSRAVSSGMMPGRRPPYSMSRPPSAHPHPPPGRIPREPSLEGLEEFSHLMLYDDAPEAAMHPPAHMGPPGTNGYHDVSPGGPHSSADMALRERELALRQRELMVREQEMGMRRGPRRPPPPRSVFDEEDEDDYFDPMENIPVPHIDPDNVDMMSITSRRAKKAPSARELRKNPEISVNGGRSSFGRYFGGGRKRASERIMQEIPGLHDSLRDNPMMAYSSNRFGAVDRNQMHPGSRANSLTASRMGDFPPHPGYPGSRRNSQSPGTPLGAPGLGPRMPRPGTAQDGLIPPNGPMNGPMNGHMNGHMNGPMNGGHPSPPGAMRAPVPRHPPGQGNAVGPQQVEQHYGVSHPHPSAKGTPNQRSLTGSASASAESGDSGASATLESENSAHSSQIDLNAQQAAAAALVR